MRFRNISEAWNAGLVEGWNSAHPIGTPVRYWTGMREGLGEISKTVTPAKLICGTAVVWIADVQGCVALSHVEALHGAVS